MTLRKLILFIALSVGLPYQAWAQLTAQAAMTVQVTVVAGNTISVANERSISLSGAGNIHGYAHLSSMNFKNAPLQAMVITRPDKIMLKSYSGADMWLPIQYSDTHNGEHIASQIVTPAISQEVQVTRGMYRGALTTSVAYL